MTISFSNPGEIDLTTLQVMGLSAKPNTDSAIGRFGTGLKYAIAITLRLNGQITIWRGMSKFTFRAYELNFRGKTPTRVTCIGPDGVETPLPFTLDYGQDWHAWQALRELESNCRDENGVSAEGILQPASGFTVIQVDCPAIEAEYANLKKIFLDPISTISDGLYCSIHPKTTHSQTGLYYRNVRVAELQKEPLFTYNFKGGFNLTEDRTISANTLYAIPRLIANSWRNCKDKNALLAVITARNPAFESDLPWEDVYFDSTPEAYKDYPIMQLVEEMVDSERSALVPPKLLRRYFELSNREDDLYVPYTPTKREAALCKKALKLLSAHCKVQPVKLVEALPNTALGLCFNGKVFLSREVFGMGFETVVGTLFEEFAHFNHGFTDESRQFQNYLINQVAKLIVELDFERNGSSD